jgi:cytochrome oxidase assembly protein ShyY1
VAGFWQLDRLHEQNAFVRELHQRMQAPPQSLESVFPSGESVGPDAVTYRRVEVTGTYDLSHETVLIARSMADVNGNHVLTPLVLPDGDAVVVDRGWVPYQLDHPPVAQAAPPSGPMKLTGVLFPSEVQDSHATAIAGPDFTKIDLARLQRQLPYRIEPVYLWLETQDPKPSRPLPEIAPLPDLTQGPPHLSYTVQWFLFASIGLVGYPLVLKREIDRHGNR